MNTKKDETLEVKKLKSIVSCSDCVDVNSADSIDYNDYSKLCDKKMKMKGFDDKYLDYVHYIVTITHNIWEEKGIGIIYDTYSNNVIMHVGNMNLTGVGGVIAGTMATLHGFPDRKLITQNVIFSEEEEGVYLSSHRINSTATNVNLSEFGEATGKKVNFRTTVDCLAKENRIFEEWLVRDNLWIVMQLGLDVKEIAMKKAKATICKNSDVIKYGYPESNSGQLSPKRYNRKDETVGEFVKELFTNIYACKDFNKVTEYYATNAVVNYICDKNLVTHNQIQGMLISLFSSLPSNEVTIDKITCNKKVNGVWDVAVRYYIRGYNDGIGFFGEPSGKYIEILGINHMLIKDNLVIKEWITFDALDVYRQIYVQKLLEERENNERDDN